MESFDLHITGDERILQASADVGLKTISIELLTKELEVIRVQHMTSVVLQFQSFADCLAHVNDVIVPALAAKSDIVRVKIESPVYDHYIEQSLYLESHFVVEDTKYPASRNAKKAAILGTDRVYDHMMYDMFREKWKNETLELCLYDTFIEEDDDWFKHWNV